MTPTNEPTERPASQPHSAGAETPLTNATRREDLRGWADFLCIWRLCDRTACRRALRCGGQADVCFPRYAPLLPDNLKTWCQMFGEARAEELTFEQAMQRIGNSPAGDALVDWHQAVAASLCTPPRQRRDAAATHL